MQCGAAEDFLLLRAAEQVVPKFPSRGGDDEEEEGGWSWVCGRDVDGGGRVGWEAGRRVDGQTVWEAGHLPFFFFFFPGLAGTVSQGNRCQGPHGTGRDWRETGQRRLIEQRASGRPQKDSCKVDKCLYG